MQAIDFGRAYFWFRLDPRVQPTITVTRPLPTTVLNVRINLECRCAVTHRRTGAKHSYVLGASCKTELVGPDRDLWMEPNADFCVAVSNDDFMVLKSWARNNMPVEAHPEVSGVPVERQSGISSDAWAEFAFDLPEVRGHGLGSIEDIIAAIRGRCPIVSRTEYDDGNYHVVIEHPVKTINYCEVDRVYQTDTGPILLPDLSPQRLERCERFVECFDLAYSAFNSAGWAEFIVNVPTPVGEGISVNHYSRPRRIEPVRNSLIQLVDQSNSLQLDGHHFK
jgi:hypothetical protein